MKITYDPRADALNITFREGRVKKTVEIAPEILIDLDSRNRPLYLEVLGASEKLGRKNTQEFLLQNLAAPSVPVRHVV